MYGIKSGLLKFMCCCGVGSEEERRTWTTAAVRPWPRSGERGDVGKGRYLLQKKTRRRQESFVWDKVFDIFCLGLIFWKLLDKLFFDAPILFSDLGNLMVL
jgi:hypothetical protein